MMISVIIPAYNEGNQIGRTIDKIKAHSRSLVGEIIVADGGSRDDTIEKAKAAGASVVRCPEKGRAAQLNYGARQARGDVLYFLHADTFPPSQFDYLINQAIQEGYQSGCFRLAFDDTHWLLRCYAWFTRFNSGFLRFGDQSLFIRRAAFNNMKGFREDHMVMEDQELMRRLQKDTSFKVVGEPVITSARKYRENGIAGLQMVFLLIFSLYYMGVSQETLANMYKQLIGNN